MHSNGLMDEFERFNKVFDSNRDFHRFMVQYLRMFLWSITPNYSRNVCIVTDVL